MPLELVGPPRELVDQALLALGRLDSVSTLLPDTALFLYMYVRKEAVLSSQIEGTRSSLSDLLLFEIDETPGVPLDDAWIHFQFARNLARGDGHDHPRQPGHPSARGHPLAQHVGSRQHSQVGRSAQDLPGCGKPATEGIYSSQEKRP